MLKRIIYAGDSTVTFNHIATYPQTGLSQGLSLYLKDDVFVRSFAINGRSTKSFIDQGRLDEIVGYLEEGDFFFIQFGHNDAKKEDPERYTDPDTDFKSNLKKFIVVAKMRGALPVLITPIARRLFDDEGHFLTGSHGKYPQAMIELAKEEGVPCIDMTSVTEAYLTSLGDYPSRHLYVYPKDNSHLMPEGAMVMAGFLADGLMRLGAPYADLLIDRNAKVIDEDLVEAKDPYMVLGDARMLKNVKGNMDVSFTYEKQD